MKILIKVISRKRIEMNPEIEEINNNENRNRCIGYLKSGKKCRYKLGENRIYKYFCCEDHLPFNVEFFENGCNICMSDNLEPSEIKILKCGHAIHKPCLQEWKNTRFDDIDKCYICRGEFNIRLERTQPTTHYINNKGVKFAMQRESFSENKFLRIISNNVVKNNSGDKISF